MSAGEYTLKDNRDHLIHPALLRSICAQWLERIAARERRIAVSDSTEHEIAEISRRRALVLEVMAIEIRGGRHDQDL